MPFAPSPVILAPLPAWFSANGRRLPWRAENLDLPHPDPYAVLVSELMLQQTQVATVVPYFQRWMARFPDPGELARAEDDEVHKLWEGLGYYRRARFLKQAATLVARQGWPEDLSTLPGLGPYTAAAVAAIAFQRPEPALDGNAYRVLARLLGILDDPRRHAARLREWLRPALSELGPSRLTQALMDLGATLCVPRPACPQCPLAGSCEAQRQGIQDRIPPVAERPKVKVVAMWLLAVEAEGRWLLLKPSARGLLAGLWRWPALAVAQDPPPASPDGPGAAQAPLEARTWAGWSQIYTHRKEQVTPVAVRIPRRFPAPPGAAWVPAAELPALPLGKRDQRLRALLDQAGASELSGTPAAGLLERIEAGEAWSAIP